MKINWIARPMIGRRWHLGKQQHFELNEGVVKRFAGLLFVAGFAVAVAAPALCNESVPAAASPSNVLSSGPRLQRPGSAIFAQRCRIPECPAGQAVCNVRRQPDGCVAWDCCPRR
jgi:hypothetical protein